MHSQLPKTLLRQIENIFVASKLFLLPFSSIELIWSDGMFDDIIFLTLSSNIISVTKGFTPIGCLVDQSTATTANND